MIRLRSDALAIAFLFIAIGVLACFAPAQSDTWWLFRAGQDIWQTRAIPLVDAYSHTAAGRYWWNHEWLAEALFYGLFRVGGLPLLAAIGAALVLSTVGLAWRMSRGTFEWRFVLFAGAALVSAASFALRPQLVSMFLAALVTWCLAENRRKWWIPVIMVFWINFHGAAITGLFLVAGAAAGDALVRRRIDWSYAGLLALCFLATGLSPIGFRTYSEIALSVERSRINALIEWLPPDLKLSNWPFWAMAAAVPITIALKWKALDARSGRLLGIALALLPLAVRSMRNMHLFVFAALPALTSAWGSHVVARNSARGERETVNGGIAMAAGVIGVAIVVAVWLNPPAPLGWRPISPAAIDAINACPAPMYNTYGDGGILIWFTPRQKVFIDNRQDPYSDELLRLNKALEMTGDYDAAFAQYGIRCAALSPGALVTSRLERDPAWRIAHRDRDWVVFRRAGER